MFDYRITGRGLIAVQRVGEWAGLALLYCTVISCRDATEMPKSWAFRNPSPELMLPIDVELHSHPVMHTARSPHPSINSLSTA